MKFYRRDIRVRWKKKSRKRRENLHDVKFGRRLYLTTRNQPVPLFMHVVEWEPEASAAGYLTGSYYGHVTKEF